MSDTLGAKLRTLRKAKKLTQDELAALLGVKRATISNYEIDRRQPSIADLKRLAEFFGVCLDFFGIFLTFGDMHKRAGLLLVVSSIAFRLLNLV